MNSLEHKRIYDGSKHCANANPSFRSRPLGMRTNGSLLICADGYIGLVGINLETGKQETKNNIQETKPLSIVMIVA